MKKLILLNEENLMRFGFVRYSKHEDYYKIQVTLVDKQLDKTDNIEQYLHKDQERNVNINSIKQEIVIKNLIDMLKNKSVLSDDEE